jgi:CubicO group peptidase (beta-lactamase class C family)
VKTFNASSLFIICFLILLISFCTETAADLNPAGKWTLFREFISRLISLEESENFREMYISEYNRDFWETADPEELGLNKQALERHLQFCKDTGADAVLVVYKGKIVDEWYDSEECREPFNVQSVTKSITGILTGMLLDEGMLPSVYEPVSSYVQGWDEEEKSRVTIYNLLSMTAGFKRMWSEGLGSTHEKDDYAAARPLEYIPGTVWEYSNEGTQLLSQILCRAAGRSIADYAEERLFMPLGMESTKLRTDDRGCVWTYSGMETTARDLARIGLLMINKGMWGDVRIVSEEWVNISTSPSQDIYKWYGLLWWLIKDLKGFAAMGGYDNYFGIFPESELIVVRIQEAPKPGIEMYQYEGRAATYFLDFFVP